MKTARFFLLAFCLGLMPICCCPNKTNWDFSGLSLAAFQGAFEPLINNEFTSDTAKLLISNSPIFVETGYRLSLTEPVFGTSCQYTGDGGLLDTVTMARLFSSTDFNGIPAGQPLNGKIRATSFFGETSLDSLAILCNHLAPDFWGAELVFKEKPAPGEPHTFTLRITQASGKVTDGVSAAVRWK